MSKRNRSWVWYGTVSHRIAGYGSGHHMSLKDRGVRMPRGYSTVACITYCGLRVEVQVPPDGVMADAGQPKGRPACPDCLTGVRQPERPLEGESW